MVRKTIMIAALCYCATDLSGQHFQFSQYNFTPQRINPALVGASDYATATLLHRNQSTEGGFHLVSNNIDMTYPLIKKKRTRWGGVGLSFLDDRSGIAGIFNTQEASLSYAANVLISKHHSLSLGVRGLYQQTTVDLDGLYTGAQFVADRGFNEQLDNGEGPSSVRNSYFTFSAGMHWQKTNEHDETTMHASFSLYDINRPDNVFISQSDALAVTMTGSYGFQAYRRKNFSISPDFLFTYGTRPMTNIGMVSRYKMVMRGGKDAAVDLITRCVPGRSGIIGFQFHQYQFSMGISYDFPVATNAANTGALELGIQIHEFKGRKRKAQMKRLAQTKPQPSTPVPSKVLSTAGDSLKSQTLQGQSEQMSARLRHKKDSLIQSAAVGDMTHEPWVLEKVVLHFNFAFNSTALDEASEHYFDDLAEVLVDNEELTIRLVGHTDNVGSDRYNLRLSQERAHAIKDYLISRGVAGYRIEVDGKGLREPLNDNSTDAKRALNRRVELLILYVE